MPATTLPWWQVNVPADLRTDECPEFLRQCGDKDRGIIGTPDARFRAHTWEQVRDIIRTNRIDRFGRKPSELRRYRHYTWELVRKYGSIMDFVVKERLRWDDLTPRGAPFTDAADVKILHNDWPYGVDERIVHLVVWTKFELEEAAGTDELTAQARRAVDEYVRKTFCTRVEAEKVVWFKNWASLKSVHAVEHFHVMLYDPEPGFVEDITDGDVPLSKTAPDV